jgi:starch synthase (maltosyl-transferring)
MAVELKIGADLLQQSRGFQDRSKQASWRKPSRGKYDAAVDAVMAEDFAACGGRVPAQAILRPFTTTTSACAWAAAKSSSVPGTNFFPDPRPCSPANTARLKTLPDLLPRIQELGFDVLYMPPIHPVGKLNRKGKNNAVTAEPGDPGSPWAIGSDEGGHKAIAPELGTLEDYKKLIREGRKNGHRNCVRPGIPMCAPDHPYIKEHPEWFLWRPDGTIMYAENPPKKYQDIVPINFETDDWENLWNELKSVVLYWVEQGVKIFPGGQSAHQAVPFLGLADWSSPARPPRSALFVGIVHPPQSDGRIGQRRLHAILHLLHLAHSQKGGGGVHDRADPNRVARIFPAELLAQYARYFAVRAHGRQCQCICQKAAHGLHPVLQLRPLRPCLRVFGEFRPAPDGKEEYHNSEKYELRHYDWTERNRLTEVMTKINKIRRENPALQTTWNIQFTRTDSDHLMSYVKTTDDLSNIIWCVVNFDTQYAQSGFVEVP